MHRHKRCPVLDPLGRECFLLEAAGLTIRPALVSGRFFYPWACHEVNAKAMLKAGV